MSSTKSSKPFSIGSLILPLTGWRAQEELNINYIGAAPAAEGWFGTLMNAELLRALYEGNPIGDRNMDSEDQFWLKRTGMDYDIWPLLQNEKWAKKLRAIFTWPYPWVIKGHCYRSWRGVSSFLRWGEMHLCCHWELNYWQMVVNSGNVVSRGNRLGKKKSQCVVCHPSQCYSKCIA